MPTRRWLLRASIVACVGATGLGLGAAAEANYLVPGLEAVRRRLAANGRQSAPGAWRDTPPPDYVEVGVDTRAPLRPISPLIYGVSVARPDQLEATGARLNRWGGNPNTRYNWIAGDAWNAARDWEFRNYGAATGAPKAPSRAADQFVSESLAAGAAAWLTVPSIGWVARDGLSAHASTGVPSEGADRLREDAAKRGGTARARAVRRVGLRSASRSGQRAEQLPQVGDDFVRIRAVRICQLELALAIDQVRCGRVVQRIVPVAEISPLGDNAKGRLGTGQFGVSAIHTDDTWKVGHVLTHALGRISCWIQRHKVHVDPSRGVSQRLPHANELRQGQRAHIGAARVAEEEQRQPTLRIERAERAAIGASEAERGQRNGWLERCSVQLQRGAWSYGLRRGTRP